MSYRNTLGKNLKRSALSVALGLCFIGTVQAQSAVGSLFGTTRSGSEVTLENPQTGMKRTIHADASGRFTFSQLPPGIYKVTAEDGTVREVMVNVGTGSQVNFSAGSNANALDTVTVVGSRLANPIDVSSVESTTVFTAEQIQALPVSSNVSSVALLAPGTVKGDSGLGSGNLASFGGSSVAENGYYINGFDVTNMRTMLSFADMPFQAIAQQQVKTGGYGAEYGRSLGGVISLVTKSGSNDWHFGGSVEWSPDWGRKSGKDVKTRDSHAENPLYAYRSDNEFERLTYSAYASGPIVKDKLFFFAMLEGRRNTDDVYRSLDSYSTRNTSPQAIVKLDWNINDSNRLEFTGLRNTSKYRRIDYQNPTGQYNTGVHGELQDSYRVENGGKLGILKYTGYLSDNFTLSGQYGYLNSILSHRDPPPPGADCPWAYDFGYTTNLVREFLGCFSSATVTDLKAPPNEDVRKGFRIDGEWLLGDHKLRFGVDRETYDSFSRGSTYSGGINWAYYTVPNNSVATGIYAGQPGRTVNGQLVAPGAQYARSRVRQTSTASYQNINSAAYIEDNWQVTDNFMAYLGLRWEKFENKNGDGVSWVKSKYELAPRLGFAWDVNGDAQIKLFGNAGRYYIPVATNSSIRATGAESTTYNWYYVSGWNDRGEPVGQGAQIGDTQVNGSLKAPHPSSVASANLSPMHQDEYILGAQFQLSDMWLVGLRGTYRKVKAGMDDACMLQPFVDWAADNGYTNFDDHSVPGCYIINPGKDVMLNLDVDGDGSLELATVPSRYFGLPEYKRSYTGLEFFWERASEKLQLQGSYTFSRSRGNMEGYVNSTLEQEDPGLTQDFDHSLFMDGGYGPLPNDRTHVIKAFGAYKFSNEWSLGGNFVASSGRPVNCQGFVPLELAGDYDVGTLTAYSASSFYCLGSNGLRSLHQRGDQGRTPWTWTLDLSATYTPRWADGKLKFKVDVYNVFNNGRVVEYVETTEAARDVLNPDYRNHASYQTPRSLRFTLRYDY